MQATKRKKKVTKKPFIPAHYAGLSREDRRAKIRSDVNAELQDAGAIGASVQYIAGRLNISTQSVAQALRFLVKADRAIRVSEGIYKRSVTAPFLPPFHT